MRPYILDADGVELHVGDYVMVKWNGGFKVLAISSLVYSSDSESATMAKAGNRSFGPDGLKAIDVGTVEGVLIRAIAESGGKSLKRDVIEEAVAAIGEITSGEDGQDETQEPEGE